MQLTFLGTSASEGYPDAFCDCENCQRARQLGGPSLRKRCAALINDDLLIDLGPDLMAAAQQHHISLANLHYCLQTHEHHDHLDPSHFASRSPYCSVFGNPRLHYYASRGAIEKAGNLLGRPTGEHGLLDPAVGDSLNLTVHAIEPFQRFRPGPYNIFSVAANHAPQLTAMLYVIERDGRCLFYGTDTSDIADATWIALADHVRRTGIPFHLVVLDHTAGLRAERSNGHMTSAQFLEQVARLRAEHLLAADARIFATHIAHHSNPPHPELVELANQRGYEIAYDGLTLDV